MDPINDVAMLVLIFVNVIKIADFARLSNKIPTIQYA